MREIKRETPNKMVTSRWSNCEIIAGSGGACRSILYLDCCSLGEMSLMISHEAEEGMSRQDLVCSK